MHRPDIPTEKGGDLAASIEGDVDAEVDRQKCAVMADARLRGIAVQYPPGTQVMSDHRRVVVPHNRANVGDGREDPFVPAGEAGHEVRLDEPEHDPAVRLDVGTIEEHRE